MDHQVTPHTPHTSGPPMQAPTVSIIVPYKLSGATDARRQMMDQLADSIPDRMGIEVVWVDDHSQVAWAPPTSRLTRHTVLPNVQGVRYAGTARNTGMDQAAGAWLLFADSDDVFDTAGLNQVVDALESLPPNDDRALVTFEAWSASEDNRHAGGHTHANSVLNNAWAQNDVQATALLYAPWCKAVKADWARGHKLRFEPTKAGNDAIFSADLALSTPPWLHLPWAVYGLRTGHVSLSTTITAQTAIDRMGVHTRVLARLAQAGRQDLLYHPTKVFSQGLLRAPRQAWTMYTTLKRQGTPLLPPTRTLLHRMRKRFTTFLTD